MPETLPRVLAAVAEAAWIGVFGLVVSATVTGVGTTAAPTSLIVAALAGFAAGWLLPAGPIRAIGVVGLALGLAGVAISASASGVETTLTPLQRDLQAALVALAALRGGIQGGAGVDDLAIDHLVRRGSFLIAGAWVVGLVIGGDARAEFASEALDATLLFIAAGGLALGGVRLARNARAAGRQSSSRPAWTVLAAIVLGATLLGVPMAAAFGVPVAQGMTTGLLGLISIVLAIPLAIGGTLGALIASLGSAVLAPLAPHETPGASPQIPNAVPSTASVSPDVSATVDFLGPLVVLGTIGLMAVIAYILLSRPRRLRPSGGPARPLEERHSFHVSRADALPTLQVPRFLRQARGPSGGADAYPRLLADWSASPGLAREPAETPAGHARRLRRTGADLGLDLLIADFELARFGGRPLTARENRRAIRRYRRLRGRPEPMTAEERETAESALPGRQNAAGGR